MNDDRRYNQLREVSWRRPLSPAEEAELRAWLVSNPKAQADWETELALSEALQGLPDAPVATNFTNRVLQAVEREHIAASSNGLSAWQRWHWRLRWLPRIAVACAVGLVGLLSYHRAMDIRQTKQWVRPLELVSSVNVPNAEILQNFEAIQALNRAPAPNAGPDEELLRLLQ